MFIDDKRTGVGSKIKDYMKYGGKWKEIYSQNTNVVITNEDFTSKTCPFCYH
jgi:hypothetical protein